jgi:hypothetical protein
MIRLQRAPEPGAAMTRARTISLLVAGCLGVGGLLCALSSVAPLSGAGDNRAAPAGPAVFGFAGNASCSARACHGGDKPVDAVAQQNEYTTSLLYDKHTRSYEVLKGERAKRMAANLAPTNPDGKPIDADKDWRCLACHATPQSAWDQAHGKKADLATANWQLGGVSCEACHGGSVGQKPWLAIHTAPDLWRKKYEKNPHDPVWKEYGFTDLADLRFQAETCAGCHVGAPPDEKNKIPARDCNHDLMAAGHPRLSFELGVFRANMPPHWNVSLKEKKEQDAEVWLVGRVIAAKAALQLLDYRASQVKQEGEARWPEFAEYRCYACHADLNPRWRNLEASKGRPRGSLPYDTWYWTLLPALNKNLKMGYDKLTDVMARPVPDLAEVQGEARLLIGFHDVWLKEKHKFDSATLLKEATTGIEKLPRSWEDATQLALAVAALKQKDLESLTPLRLIWKELSFKDLDGGPRGFSCPPADNPEVEKAFGDLLKRIR